MRDDIVGYLETVIRVEWPVQAEGLVVDGGKAYLEKLNTLANSLKPSSVAEGTCTHSCCNPWCGYGTPDSRDYWPQKPRFPRWSGSSRSSAER